MQKPDSLINPGTSLSQEKRDIEAARLLAHKKHGFREAITQQDGDRILRFLDDSDINPRELDLNGYDAFTQAIKERKPQSLSLLLMMDTASRIHQRDEQGNHLVHVAVMANSIDCMKVLEEFHAPLKVVNKDFWCPITLAIVRNQVSMAQWLLRVLRQPQPTDLDAQHKAGYCASEVALTQLLDSCNYQVDLVMLRIFINHLVHMDRSKPQAVTWREFVWVIMVDHAQALKEQNFTLADQKLDLAKNICLLELLAQKNYLMGFANEQDQKPGPDLDQVNAMIAELSAKPREFEDAKSMVNLSENLNAFRFASVAPVLTDSEVRNQDDVPQIKLSNHN